MNQQICVYIYTLWIQTLSEKVLNPLNHTPVVLPKNVLGSVGYITFKLCVSLRNSQVTNLAILGASHCIYIYTHIYIYK